jgi:autotransporter-associated beta strand protein
MTLGSAINIQLVNAQNVIAGAEGGSAKSAFGNNINISGNISDGPGVHSQLTYYGNGNSGFGGGVLNLAGSNTFSGGIVIGTPDGLNGGVVGVVSNNNLGTGSITVNSQSQIAFNASGTYGNPGQVLYANGTGLANNNISSGAFRTGAASIIWNGDLSIGTTSSTEGTNGFVVLSSTGTNIIEIHGKLTGTGSLQKQGGGTLIFSGPSNDCTGATQIGNGILTVAAGSSMSTGDLLMLQSSSNTGVALDLYNSHQNVGNLSSGFTQTSGSFFQFINLVGNGTIGNCTLNIKQTTNKSYGFGAGAGLTSTLTGPGGISLDAGSTAALTLTGPNDYQGGTVINGGASSGGTLNLANGSNGSAVGSGDLEVKANGHLATGNATVLGSPVTDGQMSGNLIVDSGGIVAPGNDSQTGTLNVGGNLTLNNGSVFNVDVTGTGVTPVTDHVTAGGTLTLASGNAIINVADASTATGVSTIISYAPSTFTGGFTLGTPAVVGARHYSLTTGSTGVVLTITDNSRVRYWSIGGGSLASTTPPGPVDGGGVWASGDGTNFFTSNTTLNLDGSYSGTPNTPYSNGDTSNVVFGNGGNGDQVTLGSNITVGSVGAAGGILVFGPTNNGAPYVIGVLNDTHTLTLVGGISAVSNATINAPVVLAQSQTFSSQAGATVTVNGGVSEGSSSLTLTKTGQGTVVLNGTSTYTGGTVISAGVLQGATWAIPQVQSARRWQLYLRRPNHRHG